MTARMPIVGGNWKMNMDLASGVALAEEIVDGLSANDFLAERQCDVAVFPPFPYLQAVGRALGHHMVMLGAQDVYHEAEGAYTGEVSVGMLSDLGSTTVLVGHSERRHVIGEDDALLNKKVHAALNGELQVVLCIGETADQRRDGTTNNVVISQLRAGLEGVDGAAMSRVVIAYEPVWAIGTGDTATPGDAQAVHAVIRAELAALYDSTIAEQTRIQYGGSVKPANAAELFAEPDIDGFLVGGASLKAPDFLSIIQATLSSPNGVSAS